MVTIQLQEGETIKIIGQNTTHLIVVNKNGDIYTRTDANRDNEFHSQVTPDVNAERTLEENKTKKPMVSPDNFHKSIEEDWDNDKPRHRNIN